MIVADTNLIASLFLAAPGTALAEAALERDREWAAPRLWRSEMRNLLALQIRHGRLELEGAVAILDRASRLLAGREYDLRGRSVLELAAKSKCTAYDCEFVALAIELRRPLVTLDRELLAAFPKKALSPEAFLAT